MIVTVCAGWGIEKDGIADYSRYFVDGIRSTGVEVRVAPLGRYIDERRYYARAALGSAGSDISHVQFNYLFFNGELPHKNRFFYYIERVNTPLVMTMHEVRVGFSPIETGFSSLASKVAYNVFLPVLNQWSVAFHAKMFAHADRIIAHTGSHVKAIQALTKDPDKVVLIPHGIPDIPEIDRGVSRLEAKKKLGLDGKSVITVPGFINKRKGYEDVLKVLPELAGDVVLMIAGGRMTENADDVAYYEAVNKIISTKGLQSRVRITGYLEEKDIPDIMAATDICLAPFSSTAASGALSLSIGYHKPIIASDISVHREISERVPCLELFKNGDPKDLLVKIRALLDDQRRLKTLSGEAAVYSHKYSYKMVAAATIDLYRDLLAERKNDSTPEIDRSRHMKSGLREIINGPLRSLMKKAIYSRVNSFFYALFNAKNCYLCPICGYYGRFKTIKPETGERINAQCPRCCSLERHRHQYLVFRETIKGIDTKKMSMLHFAPENFFRNIFKNTFKTYITADLDGEGVDIKEDLTHMHIGDEAFDFIYASHVLEHIKDDRAALSEIRRVLKPGGIAIIPVPIMSKYTIEYDGPNPHECFHVRCPGEDYYDKYKDFFAKVLLYKSSDFDDKYQICVYENRDAWPQTMPLRPSVSGEKHSDIVPVCFKNCRSPATTYNAKEYWERRFSERFSLCAVGHQGFSERYNRYMYKLKKRSLEIALRQYGIRAKGQSVLDIGCGNGFFVDYYARNGSHVTGVDITDKSVKTLSAKFPSCVFVRADIGSADIGLSDTYDIVNAFDVLYHIIDDEAFNRAIANIGIRCKNGGWVLLTDAFDPNKNVGEHVRYRDLKIYAEALDAAGIDIVGLIPVFHLMGMGVDPSVKNGLVRKALGRIIELFAWLSYLIDLAYCPPGNSIMNMLVCRKR
jgi:glycosyltransferase involved in cell wall biosynthesis/SAM-dependent methyltransferase